MTDPAAVQVRPAVADLVLIAVVMGMVGALYAAVWAGGSSQTARITVSGQPPVDIDLTVDQHIHVHGVLGESRLQVADGRIRFVASPCRHKVCVRSGWQSSRMDATACLPNRVSVAMVGGNPTYDAVNF